MQILYYAIIYNIGFDSLKPKVYHKINFSMIL